MLCGVVSLGYNVDEELVDFLKSCFSQIQHPFEKYVQQAGARYSLINYNSLFRRFFELWGAPYLGADFPPLKSKRKREESIVAYLYCLEETKWPYLDSDEELFGEEYKLDWKSICNRIRRRGGDQQRQRDAGENRQQQQQREWEEGENAEQCAGRFRRGCSSSPSELCQNNLPEQDLYSVFVSLLGADDGSCCGAGNDDFASK